ncbi:MAG: ATP-dependent protease HslVU (ClpYQ) ATPase subunit [Alteromonadaceae bacterium]|jgi:ATP-dependent protease HslVU (ClpYQ) ATPase subunit
MLSQTKSKITAAEYLTTQKTSDVKHEFFDSAISAIAGASKKHNQRYSNLVRILGNEL